jgi:NAD(P)H-dependent FMN reductase
VVATLTVGVILVSIGRELVPTAEKAYDEGSMVKRWSNLIAGMDAFIFVTPEYNRGYSGTLKTALDVIFAPWNCKPVTFFSYGGFSGGARVVGQLHQVVMELRMIPLRDDVPIKTIGLATDEKGWPTEEIYRKKAIAAIDELAWMGKVMKQGRSAVPRS